MNIVINLPMWALLGIVVLSAFVGVLLGLFANRVETRRNAAKRRRMAIDWDTWVNSSPNSFELPQRAIKQANKQYGNHLFFTSAEDYQRWLKRQQKESSAGFEIGTAVAPNTLRINSDCNKSHPSDV